MVKPLKQKHYTKKIKIKKNKTRKTKIKKHKIKKYKIKKFKKLIGGTEPSIEESDIMYQDDLVCILRPEVKKGIIIYTHYIQQPGMSSLCTLGLKTGKKLQEEGIDFSRNKIHPYIFFRAPYYSREINYSTPETEIISSFGEEKNYFGKTQIEMENYVYIRVDPDRTFVFSSEIRAKNPQDIQRSKKTLSNYLSIIANNAIIYSRFIEPSYITKKRAAYNLFTSELIPVPLNETYNGGGFDDNTIF